MRAARTIVGLALVLVAVPMLLVGGLGWLLMQHRGADGGFGATLEPLTTNGYAIVVSDLGTLVDRQGPAGWLGESRVRISARTAEGAPVFVAAGPAADVAAYLADVPRADLTSVGAARGSLPVHLTEITGRAAPANPREQGFWQVKGESIELRLPESHAPPTAVVLLSEKPGLALTARAAVYPRGLNSTTWTMLFGGTLALLLGLATAWPSRRRELVHVVETERAPLSLADFFEDPLPVPARPALALPAVPAEIVRSVVLPAAQPSAAPVSGAPVSVVPAWPVPSPAVATAQPGSAAARFRVNYKPVRPPGKGGSHRAVSNSRLPWRRAD